MQKKLIALAIAGLSGAAFAQSNVTIYGVADVSYENAKATGAAAAGTNVESRSRMTTNSSYIGFKGSESLGNGMTALFQMETAVSMDHAGTPNTTGTTLTGTAAAAQNQYGFAGTTASTMRDTFVAVGGGFGTVLAGYLSTPYRSMSAGFDVMPGATGVGGYNGVFGKAASNAVTGAVNLNFRTQAVAYATPTVGGFSGVIAYVPNEQKSNSAPANKIDPSGWNLAINYANGPAKVGYSYLVLKDIGIGGMVDEKHKAHLLGGSYAFGNTSVSAMYQKFDGDFVAAAGGVTQNLKNNAYFIGLKHAMGAHEVGASYSTMRDGSGTVFDAGNALAAVAKGDTGSKQFSLRYGYNFSKRTSAYAVYSKITNDAASNFDFGAGTGVGGAFGAGADPKAFGVGLRHNF